MSNLNVPELFGSYTFNDAVMKERLPEAVYKSLRETIDEGKPLDLSIADDVARAMKEWAVDLGATHYTHWFQPLNNGTAEKHDSFINGTKEGSVMMELSGKELLRAEPDASSFPSGGLRSTAAARGYTAWDCTSPAFVKDTPDGTKVLCIPTAFTSYTGESLDHKTPLLRAQDAISKQAKRVLALFGKYPARVQSSVGPEQEYFIVDRALYEKREDLELTGRTLFGAPAPKGQEMDDNYFGSINDRILTFMNDLNDELWKYGILAKTQHNEVGPGQCELAVIYNDTNTATDNNELVMELMRKIAARHGLACLLHEKPFAGINGSGKHNNWSIATSDGENLMNPTDDPENNLQFQVFLAAVVAAVDNHAELLRASASSVGNEHRLGAQEAPTAIVSIYLGEQLDDMMHQIIEKGEATSHVQAKVYDPGVSTLPKFTMDATDRNRTAPFAFTGNKFEFRMVGSTQNCSQPLTVINTIVADQLRKAADKLEPFAGPEFEKAAKAYVQETFTNHGRVVFNGNGYSQEWVEEAARRGLPSIGCMVDAVQYYTSPKTIRLFQRMGVMSEVELRSRAAVMYELYAKSINIEGRVMVDMAKREILPAVMKYEGTIAKEADDISAAGTLPNVHKKTIAEISSRVSRLEDATEELARRLEGAKEFQGDDEAWAKYYYNEVFKFFPEVRKPADELEGILAKDAWPMPTYEELLFEL